MNQHEQDEAMRADAATLVKALAELFTGKTSFVVTKTTKFDEGLGDEGNITETTYQIK